MFCWRIRYKLTNFILCGVTETEKMKINNAATDIEVLQFLLFRLFVFGNISTESKLLIFNVLYIDLNATFKLFYSKRHLQTVVFLKKSKNKNKFDTLLYM